VVADVAACPGDRLVVADKETGAPNGLRVYHTSGTEITTAPMPIGIDPQSAQGLICY
jgi:hypothetical protein